MPGKYQVAKRFSIFFILVFLLLLIYDVEFFFDYFDKEQLIHDDTNEIYLVTGASGSGKSSFIGSICQNLLDF